jgi:GLPGLI family protein
MKRMILIFFCLAISNSILAQSSAICTYKISKNKDSFEVKNNDNTANNTKRLIKEAVELAETFNYALKFNKTESIFTRSASLENESKSLYLHPIAITLIGTGIYYQNKKEKENLHQIESLGSLFLITDSFEGDWEITKETKIIGQYICFKAIKKCKSCHNNDEVWFTPEIAVPFGPIGYSGLPGLVIEVKKRIITLRLIKIDFQLDDIIIKKPSKGKVITIDKYNEMTINYRSQVKE